jgi:ABC-type lipoprotein export system ATPase subunit
MTTPDPDRRPRGGDHGLVATHDEALIDLADEVLRLEDGHLVT